MYKGLLLLLLLFGMVLVVVEFIRTSQKCPTQKVIYKYIPRTFEQEQEEPIYVSDIFRTMFTQPSTWIGEVTDLDTRKRENINQFFISQM